jgi:hypothetical protein
MMAAESGAAMVAEAMAEATEAEAMAEALAVDWEVAMAEGSGSRRPQPHG